MSSVREYPAPFRNWFLSPSDSQTDRNRSLDSTMESSLVRRYTWAHAAA